MIIAVTLIAVLLLWATLHVLLRSERLAPEPYCVSHRGAAGMAPENTLAGVRAAAYFGAGYTEVDVHRTMDGVLVVMHDASVDRTTDGSGRIRELTWQAIRELDAGGVNGARREPVPSVRDVLAQTADDDLRLIIEVKQPELYPDIAADLAGLLSQQAPEQVVVVSFDHAWLTSFHTVAPQVPLGPLYVWLGRSPRIPNTHFVDVYWLSVILDPTLIWRAHRSGHEVVVWTVNAPAVMRLLLQLGVDGITTDRPDLWPHRPLSP